MEKPKILILSCNTGQGHNSAGLAIEEELGRRAIPCEMLDTLSFASDRVSRTVSRTYTDITTRVPSLFGGMYRVASLVSSGRRKSPVYFANIRYAAALGAYIREQGFSAVVMPHLFPAEALTHLKRRGALSVPAYAVATDYTCIPFWEETDLTGYFIPHPDLLDEFADKGIPREKLFPTGLPVSQSYTGRLPQAQARTRLGLPETGPLLLVMTGSMGYGDMSAFARELLACCPPTGHIRILTGRNQALFDELSREYAQEPRIAPVPFTPEVSLYMDACDVLLTKPGGLTSTEAAVKNVPLVHTRPIPGCETQNARFFSQRGLSLFREDPQEAAQAAGALMADGSLRAQMARRQRETLSATAARDIVDHILDDLGRERP